MAEIEDTDEALVIHVTGWDKVWALTSQLTILRAHVVSAEPAAEEARRWWKGIRLPGLLRDRRTSEKERVTDDNTDSPAPPAGQRNAARRRERPDRY